MKKKLSITVGVVLVLIIIVLVFILRDKYSSLRTQTALTKKEKLQKDSLKSVLEYQSLLSIELKVLTQQQARAKESLLQSTGLSDLQLPGIYWNWDTDSLTIVEGIKNFKLYDAEREDYPDYRWSIFKLTKKTFDNSYTKSMNRSNSLIDLFIRVPNLFKIIYDLNKIIFGSLKTKWELPNQGEELSKYLGSTRYPYEEAFEAYFQKHVRNSLLVFSGQEWQVLDSVCQKHYPQTFKSEQDTKREYGNWRVVRSNFSPESKAVLLYVLTDYNGGVALQSATVTTTTKSKSISDWFK